MIRPLLFITIAVLLSGCTALGPRLGPVDLTQPGWEVRNGSALWTPKQGAPELAGEVIMAHHPKGNSYVQFSKDLPLVIAQREGHRWQVSIPAQNKEYRWRGQPPSRVIWGHLVDIWQGAPPPNGWKVVTLRTNDLQLVHPDRGERLQIIMD